jgi:hypothetical protein
MPIVTHTALPSIAAGEGGGAVEAHTSRATYVGWSKGQPKNTGHPHGRPVLRHHEADVSGQVLTSVPDEAPGAAHAAWLH